jgi:O-antigen/teichoic acid export membrane protein
MAGYRVRGRGCTLPRVLVWTQKGGFAVLDQGLYAGTNFVINIVLARWLEPHQYGAFAIAYSVFLLLATLHTAVLTEPMLVFGAGRYGDRFPTYIGLLIYGHWVVSGVIALILALTAVILWRMASMDLAPALAALAIASPLMLLLWLVRRVFYVYGQPQWSATGGMLYLALMLAGLYELYREEWLSAAWALVIMACASLAASLWLSTLLRPQWRSGGSYPTLGLVFADHWRYAKWSLPTAVLIWASSSLYYALLPVWVGLEGSAALRAVLNLIMPILHANSAVSILLLPLFVRALKAEDHAGFYRLVRLALMLFVLGSACYWGLLLLFRTELLLWIYGGRYAEYADLLVLAGLIPLPMAVTFVSSSALMAMERPDQIFWCHIVATLIAVTLGLWLLVTHGVAGAVVGGLASWFTAAVVVTWVVWRRRVRELLMGSETPVQDR